MTGVGGTATAPAGVVGTSARRVRPRAAPAGRAPRTGPRGQLPEALVLAAFLAGCALRLANLRGIPPALNQDEAIGGYDAYSLWLTGRDHLGHPFSLAGLESFGDWVSPLLTFLTVPAVGLFGLRVEVLRAVAAAVGALAIPAVYLLAVELFGRRSLGALAAWLLALSPWHVHLSRWAIPPATVPTMVTLTLLAFAWTVRRRSDRGIVATAALAALTVLAYPTMKLYVPLLGLAALFLYGGTVRRLRREALLYAALAFLAVAGPHLYLSVRDPAGRARFEQVSVLERRDAGAALLARQYGAYFSPRFLFAEGDRDPMHLPPGRGVELRWALPFLLAGLAWLVYRAARPLHAVGRRPKFLVLAALALYPVPGALTVPAPHALRAAHLIPLLALVGAAGVVAVFDGAWWLLQRVGNRAWRAPAPVVARPVLALLAVAVAVAYGVEWLGRARDYVEDYPDRVLREFQYGLDEAVGYARAHEGEYGEIWFSDDIRAAYAYVLFYTAWPPSDAHRELRVRRAPPKFNRAEALGPYRFGEPPGVRREDLPLLHTARDPTGRAAYLIRGGATPAGTRILLVYPP